jgi:hypothetical protein
MKLLHGLIYLILLQSIGAALAILYPEPGIWLVALCARHHLFFL